jgi:hypothetical protein
MSNRKDLTSSSHILIISVCVVTHNYGNISVTQSDSVLQEPVYQCSTFYQIVKLFTCIHMLLTVKQPWIIEAL